MWACPFLVIFTSTRRIFIGASLLFLKGSHCLIGDRPYILCLNIPVPSWLCLLPSQTLLHSGFIPSQIDWCSISSCWSGSGISLWPGEGLGGLMAKRGKRGLLEIFICRGNMFSVLHCEKAHLIKVAGGSQSSVQGFLSCPQAIAG